jgi:allantoinase
MAWEGFPGTTEAAAAGGITTVVDMPLSGGPAVTTVDVLHAKARAVENGSVVDYGFWGAAVPENVAGLEPLLRAGALGCVATLTPSGVDDRTAVDTEDLDRVASVLAGAGAPLLVHCEHPDPPSTARHALGSDDPSEYSRYLLRHPSEAEAQGIERLASLAATHRCPVHALHISSADVWHTLAEARERDLLLSAETCPHYLTFDAEAIPDGATGYKCVPPIRDAINRQLLWNLVEGDLVTMVVSDHSPCPAGLKAFGRGDFLTAWPGIQSLQVSLPAVWTEAATRGHDLADVVRWMCEEPARLAGLDHRKGRIAPGFDADLVVFDPEAQWTVEPQRLLHRHPHTPYAGRVMRGRVLSTFLRGRAVFSDGRVSAERHGAWLRRK